MNTKASKKIIYAVIMLLISAMLVGTTTYAWFSMNKTVTVTGGYRSKYSGWQIDDFIGEVLNG